MNRIAPRPQRLRLALTLLLIICAAATAKAQAPSAMPGSQLWEMPADPAAAMVDGIHRFFDRETALSVERRAAKWRRDDSSPEAYARSVEPNRQRLRTILGAVGERTAPVRLSYDGGPDAPVEIISSALLTVRVVKWTVYPGVEAQGLWLEPKGSARASAVVMGDCDQTPESLAGWDKKLPESAQTARLLAERGCRVLVPLLIDRSNAHSGNPQVRMTNLPHREWIYRMAYETGRHLIGYEIDQALAAIDWLEDRGGKDHPIGIVGHGEGGLIALGAAALDPRIDAAWVGGYFQPRERVWAQTIDRNVWGLLDEFGDAELASLIAPRALIIEACKGPVVDGPPPPRDGNASAASGKLASPIAGDVVAEAERARRLAGPKLAGFLQVVGDKIADGQGDPNSDGQALAAFFAKLTRGPVEAQPPASASARSIADRDFRPGDRMKPQVDQWVNYTQSLVRTSELRRDAFWAKADRSSPERWAESTKPHRDRFWSEIIGKYPPASEPLSVESKLIRDEPKWRAYAVKLPVWPDVFAYGVLLLPKDLKEGEKRPVVVCQHGLEGTPEPLIVPGMKSPYNSYAAQLADLGYITYAPQNPYIGHDRFRTLIRKSHPLKHSLYDVIVRQHERTVEWLKTLGNVDPSRIAFYGLSYGGKSAMRIPALVPGYCLSICSADFNEWVVKNTNIERRYSYMWTVEYDMYEFGLSEGYNYAEIAGLIAPRPFMVERGHDDGVAPDEWVAYEYAKVRGLYDQLGIGDRTEIEFFNGGHLIHGQGTFRFLAKHLNWPRGVPKAP